VSPSRIRITTLGAVHGFTRWILDCIRRRDIRDAGVVLDHGRRQRAQLLTSNGRGLRELNSPQGG